MGIIVFLLGIAAGIGLHILYINEGKFKITFKIDRLE